MSWLCDYLDHNGTNRPYEYTVSKTETVGVEKMFFVDDSILVQNNPDDLQKMLDLMSTFHGAVGNVIKAEKSFTIMRAGGRRRSTEYRGMHIKVYKGMPGCLWQPVPVDRRMQQKDAMDEWRYLGNTQSMTTGAHVTIRNRLKGIMAEHATGIARTQLTMEGVSEILSIKSLSKLLFPATYANMGKSEIDDIRSSIMPVVKRKLGLPSTYPYSLLHGQIGLGGVEIPNVETLINANRLLEVVTIMREGGLGKKVMEGALHRLSKWSRHSGGALSTKIHEMVKGEPLEQRGVWLSYLWTE
jgi:hypothetical protein